MKIPQRTHSIGMGFVLLMIPTSVLSWQYRFPGPPCVEGQVVSYSGAVAVSLDKEGEVYAAGWSDTETDQSQFLVVKVSGKTGKEVWRFEALGTLSHPGSPNLAADLVLDSVGNVIVAGYLENKIERGGNLEPFAVKLAGGDGRVLWKNDFHRNISAVNGSATTVITDSKDSAILVGTIANPPSALVSTGVKLDGTSGEEMWRYPRTSGFGSFPSVSQAPDVARLPDDDLAIIVNSPHLGPCWSTAYLARVSGRDGDGIWRRTFECGANRKVMVDPRGGILVLEERIPTNFVLRNEWEVRRYDASTGQQVWRTSTGKDLYAWISSMSLMANSDVMTAGSPFVVARFNGENGDLVWQSQVFTGNSPFTHAQALVIDRRGDPIVGGRVEEDRFAGDLAIARLSGVDGRVIWARTVSGFSGGDDVALALAADEEGNVVVAGQMSSGPGCGEFVVTKWLGENGKDFPIDKSALIAAIEESLEGLDVQAGLKKSLLSKLQAASRLLLDLQKSNESGVVGLLEAFQNEVRAHRGGKIPEVDADALLSAVEEVLGLLSTQDPS